MAAGRSLATTMSLATRLSYSGGTRAPTSPAVSTRTSGPDGIAQCRIVPGVGAKPRPGSSAVRRTSMACLVGSPAPAAAPRAASDRGRPAASQSCSRTMSSPLTSSVTPCSTWRRVLTSRNQTAPSGLEQEFRGRRVGQACGRGDADRAVVQGQACLAGEPRRRRLLDELLVAALDRAVALADGHDGPARVAEQLDLDVSCRADLPFEVDRPVAERRSRPRPTRSPARLAGPRPARRGACLVPRRRRPPSRAAGSRSPRLRRRRPPPRRAGRPARRPASLGPSRPRRCARAAAHPACRPGSR